MHVEKLDIKLIPNPKRVILRYLKLNKNRIQNVINKLLLMSDVDVKEKLEEVFSKFSNRHYDLEKKLLKNYNKAADEINFQKDLSNSKKILIGSYFSHEYSIEAAALFNPSIVQNPKYKNSEDKLNFIMSVRAVGEGHISSVEFRTGIIENEEISIDNLSGYCEQPAIIGGDNENESYSTQFDDNLNISEKVLFPQAKIESMGIEDVRFVHFEDGEEDIYYATYTAYNGQNINSQLIETTDFSKFKISKLIGDAICDKGMALFPKKINDKYCMIGRQDGENLYIMYSENVYDWNLKELLIKPQSPHEIIQLGNCGSPIETENGWLLLTHSVGPIRTYSIGAILLDLENPSKVIGLLDKPMIEANENEREGYVPNVVYTCGSIKWKENLWIPYAQSDSSCSFAKVSINELINEMIN